MQLHDVHQGIHSARSASASARDRLGARQDRDQGAQGAFLAPGVQASPPLSEGGQMPLARRVPKRGFVNGAFRKEYAIVT